MKEKTNKWIPWISASLIGVILSAALVFALDSFVYEDSFRHYIPTPTPSAQLVGISVIEAINEFSGDESDHDFSKEIFIGTVISLISMFIVVPYLFLMGTLQSEEKENPTALWYAGSSLMLMVVVLPIIVFIIKFLFIRRA